MENVKAPDEISDVTTAGIGATIKALRVSHGLTQTDLANRVGLAQQRISVIESATPPGITYGVLDRIFSALGYKFDLALSDKSTQHEDHNGAIIGETKGVITTGVIQPAGITAVPVEFHKPFEKEPIVTVQILSDDTDIDTVPVGISKEGFTVITYNNTKELMNVPIEWHAKESEG